jgi:hypothetical protein
MLYGRKVEVNPGHICEVIHKSSLMGGKLLALAARPVSGLLTNE